MMEPSHWLEQGIELDASGALSMFRFTEALQARSDELLRLSKAEALAPEQSAELEGLSQIFTYVNSLLAAQALWSLPHSENWWNQYFRDYSGRSDDDRSAGYE